jgi:hypothetical protein
MEFSKTLERISKSYFFTMMAREAKRLVEKDYRRMMSGQLRRMELDKKHLLRRVGLKSYSPVRTSVGASLLFVGGCAAGALIGLSLAPMRGAEFRNQLKSKTGQWGRREYDRGQPSAQH